MVDRLATSLDAANVLCAGVHAFIVDAGLVPWTVRADHAFWMTACNA